MESFGMSDDIDIATPRKPMEMGVSGLVRAIRSKT